MAKKLYVGNFSGMTSRDLQKIFEPHGTVRSVQAIAGPYGRSKGFGFVEMDNPDEAPVAIDTLNGQEVNGRVLTVKEARPRKEQVLRAPVEQFANDYFG